MICLNKFILFMVFWINLNFICIGWVLAFSMFAGTEPPDCLRLSFSRWSGSKILHTQPRLVDVDQASLRLCCFQQCHSKPLSKQEIPHRVLVQTHLLHLTPSKSEIFTHHLPDKILVGIDLALEWADPKPSWLLGWNWAHFSCQKRCQTFAGLHQALLWSESPSFPKHRTTQWSCWSGPAFWFHFQFSLLQLC